MFQVVIATKTGKQLQEQLGYDLLCTDSVPLDGRGGGGRLPQELTSRGYRWCRTCRIIRRTSSINKYRDISYKESI